MTDNNAMVPAEIPAYALTSQKSADFAAMFDDLMFGLSAGAPPQIRCKQGRFRLVVGGEETPILPKELAEGEFLPLIILGAKRAFSKAYYASAYDPAADASAPDCWSDDSEKPDASIAKPMCTTCATCPMNAFGSGRNQNGQPTDGKACRDTKKLAVLYKGDVYELSIPPSSLKPFAVYMKTLQGRMVSPGNVITFLGLDQTSETQKYTFKVGAFVPEAKIADLAELAQSMEVKTITHPSARPVAAKPAAPAPAPAPAKQEDPAPEEAEEPKQEVKAAAKPRGKAKAKGDDEGKEEGSASGVPSDDELKDLLGF